MLETIIALVTLASLILYVLFARRGMPTDPLVLEWAKFIVRSNCG